MTRGYTYDNPRLSPVASVYGRGRSRPHQKGSTQDKPSVPRSPVAGGKSTLRRQPPPGSKVSHITKHFERISKDNERSTRRYAVIRGGRKPRPVASARAKVEILDSVRDAVKDEESESSFESSEADDEGDGDDDDDEAPVPALKKNDSMNSTISRPETDPGVLPVTESPAELETSEGPPLSGVVRETNGPPVTTPLRTVNEAAESVLPSTSTSPTMFASPLPSATRPHTTTDTETSVGERGSIFQKLTGFWPGYTPQSRFRSQSDVEDLMADPEHIFRDASMVVRTDEPTSIIALALKYVVLPPL
jgi:1-phosphatidylinositol-3-phosphate 5-kinase